MARLILIDAGILGLLCSSPTLPTVQACRSWLDEQGRAGTRALICDVSNFEVRRELIRLGATAKLRRLDALCLTLGTTAVNGAAWQRAAELWALVRRAGLPTAAPESLDCDVVLGAVAVTIGDAGDQVIVATDNFGHFGRFPDVDARSWTAIS